MIYSNALLKRTLCFLLIIFTAITLISCGKGTIQQTATPSETTSATATEALTPSLSPVSTPTETPSPSPTQKLSYTTGLPFEGDYKPVMADIENSPAARPQLGLQTADVVYEVPVEGDITRFVCVFSDNVPDKVMPVRSGRVPFLYIQHEWDAVFMHYGGSGSDDDPSLYSYYGNPLRSGIKIEIDGLKGKWDDYFYRTKDKKAPHNVVGNPKLAQRLYNYDPKPLGWLFSNNSSYSGDTASEIDLKMCSSRSNYVSYKYDPLNDVYLRSMDGKPFMSAETGKQLTVKNVIVMYSTYQLSSVVKVWNMVGTGNADIYIGGKLIKGSWERDTADNETVFKDDKGNQIVLRPGNTWIHICPQGK